jgi:heme exporter protein B
MIGRSGYWQQVWAIARKDLTLERRTRQSVTAMLVFAIAAVITFNFALEAELDAVRRVSLGLLWAVIWLAGTLGLNRSFAAETESRALDAILIAPAERSTFFFGKVISLTVSLALMQAVLIPIFVLLFDKPFYRPMLLLLFLLGTIGYVAAGVFVSSMAAQTRSGYLLIPILVLPLTMPVVLAAATGSAEFMLPDPDWRQAGASLSIVIMYDLLMLLAGFFAYNYLVDE